MEPLTFNLIYQGELIKSGPNYIYKSYLYNPKIASDTYIWLYYNDDNSFIITAECNDIDVDSKLLRSWLYKTNGDLDELILIIEKEYGEQAPGFDEDSGNEYTEPIFKNIKWNPDRKITIYTWGKKYRSSQPIDSIINFNAGVITGHRNGMNLKKINGLDDRVQQAVKSGNGYIQFMEAMISKIESDNLQIISINCTAGRHRSVSCAEILKQEFYPNAVIYHLELKDITSNII
jgi:hypothetical protein